MEAILLAGGLGTRLKGVTGDKYPKPLAELNGVPFIHYLIKYLMHAGVKKFVFAVSHHGQMVADNINQHFPELDVSFSFEDEPLGTGGAIKQALTHIKGDSALVLNSDSFMEFSLDKFLLFSDENPTQINILCTQVEDISRFGAVQISDDNNVSQFNEKGLQGQGFINSGVYFVPKSHPKINGLSGKFSFENDVLAAVDVPVFAMKAQGVFFDIGTPADLQKSQHLLDGLLPEVDS